MRYRYLLPIVVACAVAVGCSGKGNGSGGGVAVSGKVTWNGNPVPGARVIFTDGATSGMPSGPNAFTDDTGVYALVNVKPGSYKVVVYKLIPKKGTALPVIEEDSGMDLTQLEASGMGTHALPQKYARVSSTTLVAQVADGANKDIDLKLTGQVERTGP